MACIEQAVRMVNYNGTAVTIGFPASTDEVTLSVGNIDTGVYWNKVNLTVSHCGDALPSTDFPLLAQLYLQGQLDLDRMVTQEIELGDVEAAFHTMEAGNVIRSVIRY
jgi:S-(hydroxymethyl)mycothiol dehydrogenase